MCTVVKARANYLKRYMVKILWNNILNYFNGMSKRLFHLTVDWWNSIYLFSVKVGWNINKRISWAWKWGIRCEHVSPKQGKTLLKDKICNAMCKTPCIYMYYFLVNLQNTKKKKENLIYCRIYLNTWTPVLVWLQTKYANIFLHRLQLESIPTILSKDCSVQIHTASLHTVVRSNCFC